MTSPAAIQFGKFYHIYNRGNNRENIFVERRNYKFFLLKYAQYIAPIADTYACCLLRNHFHLLVRIKDLDEVAVDLAKKKPGHIFGNFCNAYARAFNLMYGRSGSLFRNPFGRVEVQTNQHLFQLVVYIHQNPQKHGFVDDFRDWPYSSFGALLGSGVTRLERGEVLDWFGGLKELDRAHDFIVPENEVRGILIEGDE